jgi:hypothetical protein
VTPQPECPHCHRTAWLLGDPEREPVCDACGSALAPLSNGVFPYLAAAVRRRFARDAPLNKDQPRFVRDRR